MNSPIQSEQRLCIDVHDLEHQLSFVTDECKLLNPVKVSYVHVNGEGHIKVEPATTPDYIMLTPKQVERAKSYIMQYKFGGNTERGVIELLWEVVGDND